MLSRIPIDEDMVRVVSRHLSFKFSSNWICSSGEELHPLYTRALPFMWKSISGRALILRECECQSVTVVAAGCQSTDHQHHSGGCCSESGNSARSSAKVWMKMKDYNSIKSFIEYAELSVYPLIVMNMCQVPFLLLLSLQVNCRLFGGYNWNCHASETNRICWINLPFGTGYLYRIKSRLTRNRNIRSCLADQRLLVFSVANPFKYLRVEYFTDCRGNWLFSWSGLE